MVSPSPCSQKIVSSQNTIMSLCHSSVSCVHWTFIVLAPLALLYLGCNRILPKYLLDQFLPTNFFNDALVLLATVAFCALGLKVGASGQIASILGRCLPAGFVGAVKTYGTSKSSKSKCSYTVCTPSPTDVKMLKQLYNDDYVQAHRQMHPSAHAASIADWEAALGPVDFDAVIRDQDAAGGDVRLLKCVKDDSSAPPDEQPPMGYILYELRTKGTPGKRPQRYCEVVNVIVGKNQQGSGLGRLLYEEMLVDLEKTAKAHAGDVRLFVAKANARPLQWYRRLGFKDAGWQKECLGEIEVQFLRMMRMPPAP